MKIKDLQKVACLDSTQFVVINDTKNNRTIESLEGWVLEPDYDYEGYNYEEISRIMNLRVYSFEFGKHALKIWAS